MKTHGIIPDEWIVSYASGALSEAHALVVATHCHFHPELQQKLDDAENIGAMFMVSNQPAQVSSRLFEEIITEIDSMSATTELPSDQEGIPYPLAEYLNHKSLDQLKWRMMGPGLSQVRLWTGPNDECLWLLKAKGGAKIPSHDHKELEFTLVLQGSYHVGDEHYRPGLLEIADDNTKNHTPIIDPGEDCICLVVTEAPIKIHSFMGRLAQPFIGL